jgi:hypothetical protein
MDMTQYASAAFVNFEAVRDKPVQGKIREIAPGKYDKPVVTLHDGSMITLNATSVTILIRALGPDSRDWMGHTIEAYAGQTTFQGQPRDSVLVRPLTAPTKQELAERAVRKAPPPDMDDEIPF